MARPRTPAGRARATDQRLERLYPGSARQLCALEHGNPFELLVATILSAQCTDERVNRTTPALFARFPDAGALAAAELSEVEALIRPTGFFRSKAKSLVGMAETVQERFDGSIPSRMSELVALPGVGRKTANVVRSVDFGLPGLPVDTHVLRLSLRLGLSEQTDPVKLEQVLNGMVPASRRGAFSVRLILHGRAVCQARTPRCALCVLADFCPTAAVRPKAAGGGDRTRARRAGSVD